MPKHTMKRSAPQAKTAKAPYVRATLRLDALAQAMADPDLRYGDKCTFFAILRARNNDIGKSVRSLVQIARDIGGNRKTVERSIRKLVEHGYIEYQPGKAISRDGTWQKEPNIYVVNNLKAVVKNRRQNVGDNRRQNVAIDSSLEERENSARLRPPAHERDAASLPLKNGGLTAGEYHRLSPQEQRARKQVQNKRYTLEEYEDMKEARAYQEGRRISDPQGDSVVKSRGRTDGKTD